MSASSSSSLLFIQRDIQAQMEERRQQRQEEEARRRKAEEAEERRITLERDLLHGRYQREDHEHPEERKVGKKTFTDVQSQHKSFKLGLG